MKRDATPETRPTANKTRPNKVSARSHCAVNTLGGWSLERSIVQIYATVSEWLAVI